MGLFAMSFKENKDLARALNIFGEVSAWVVVPIMVALVAGKYLDGRFGTKPWIFISATALAFLFSMAGITKILAKYLKEIEKETKGNKNDGTPGTTN